MAREGLIVYHEYRNGIKKLKDADAGKLLKALLDLSAEDLDNEPSGPSVFLYEVMKEVVMRDKDRYKAVCEARAASGKKGGRPKTTTDEEKQKKQKLSDASEEKQKKPTKLNETKLNETKLNLTDISISDDIDIESIGESDDSPTHPPKKEKPIRHKYGSYGNVLLSDEDYNKLVQEFPDDYQQRIERLSEYIASKGAKYANHLATIRTWARKDAEQARGSPKKSNGNDILRDMLDNGFFDDEEDGTI